MSEFTDTNSTVAELSDAELDAAWDETESTEAGGEALDEEKPADQQDNPAEGKKPAEGTEKQENPQDTTKGTETAAPEPAPAEDTYTLKHMDEVRTVGRDEVVKLAQQGMDYERIRQERDQLRDFRKEADPAYSIMKTLADKAGMNVTDYLDFVRRQQIMQTGVSEETARAQVSVEKQRAEIERQRAELDEAQKQTLSQQNAEKQRADARKEDIGKFLKSYPDVKPSDIPKEVWDGVNAGESLVSAYTRYQNTQANEKIKQLEADLAAEKQNSANRGKTPGSLSSEGEKGKKDAIDAAWYDGT